MMIRIVALFALLLSCVLEAADRPNMIFILADDMGYGDVAHAGGKVATPHLDRLAAEGMRFTDAHTTSSVCTPTRYGILCGRYNWRSILKKGVLGGYSSPLIPAERQTVAGFLRNQGYATGCVGKWHLGIEWQKLPKGQTRRFDKDFAKGRKSRPDMHAGGWDVDYTASVKGPLLNGFDYFWGIAASLDMPPYVYIENDRATEVPTARKAFTRPGPAAMDFEPSQCLMDFARQSRGFIRKQAVDKSKPFFLYVPLTSPHTPIVPSKAWQGKSTIGRYGDFVMETDWVVGEVLAELEAQGIGDDTLVVFTTDNGCSPAARISALVAKGHRPNAHWRGYKADLYEGGHRVPFIARWPNRVAAGSFSSSTITTADFFRTAAAIVGKDGLIDNAVAEDSFSFLGELSGKGTTARTTAIHHSVNGHFAIRKGKWKLLLAPGSGGWSAPRPTPVLWKKGPIVQLFDLDADPVEKANVAEALPEVVKELVDCLASEVKRGRCTPGETVGNDGAIPFHASLLAAFPQLIN